MHIIFTDEIDSLSEKYTVLELDTFRFASTGQEHTAWAVVESIPLTEFALIETYQSLHHNLIQEYRKQNWEYCRDVIQALTGKWNGELDTFYEELLKRIAIFEADPPTSEWTGVLER